MPFFEDNRKPQGVGLIRLSEGTRRMLRNALGDDAAESATPDGHAPRAEALGVVRPGAGGVGIGGRASPDDLLRKRALLTDIVSELSEMKQKQMPGGISIESLARHPRLARRAPARQSVGIIDQLAPGVWKHDGIHRISPETEEADAAVAADLMEDPTASDVTNLRNTVGILTRLVAALQKDTWRLTAENNTLQEALYRQEGARRQKRPGTDFVPEDDEHRDILADLAMTTIAEVGSEDLASMGKSLFSDSTSRTGVVATGVDAMPRTLTEDMPDALIFPARVYRALEFLVGAALDRLGQMIAAADDVPPSRRLKDGGVQQRVDAWIAAAFLLHCLMAEGSLQDLITFAKNADPADIEVLHILYRQRKDATDRGPAAWVHLLRVGGLSHANENAAIAAAVGPEALRRLLWPILGTAVCMRPFEMRPVALIPLAYAGESLFVEDYVAVLFPGWCGQRTQYLDLSASMWNVPRIIRPLRKALVDVAGGRVRADKSWDVAAQRVSKAAEDVDSRSRRTAIHAEPRMATSVQPPPPAPPEKVQMAAPTFPPQQKAEIPSAPPKGDSDGDVFQRLRVAAARNGSAHGRRIAQEREQEQEQEQEQEREQAPPPPSAPPDLLPGMEKAATGTRRIYAVQAAAPPVEPARVQDPAVAAKPEPAPPPPAPAERAPESGTGGATQPAKIRSAGPPRSDLSAYPKLAEVVQAAMTVVERQMQEPNQDLVHTYLPDDRGQRMVALTPMVPVRVAYADAAGGRHMEFYFVPALVFAHILQVFFPTGITSPLVWAIPAEMLVELANVCGYATPAQLSITEAQSIGANWWLTQPDLRPVFGAVDLSRDEQLVSILLEDQGPVATLRPTTAYVEMIEQMRQEAQLTAQQPAEHAVRREDPPEIPPPPIPPTPTAVPAPLPPPPPQGPPRRHLDELR